MHLPLLLALALGTVPAPPAATLVRVVDFSTLTLPEATRLHGRRVRVVVDLDVDSADLEDGWTVYDAVSSGADEMRTVWAAGELGDGVQVVEGRLVVIQHAAWGWVPAFVESRLMDARPIGPAQGQREDLARPDALQQHRHVRPPARPVPPVTACPGSSLLPSIL
jgi:hypothetical protein